MDKPTMLGYIQDQPRALRECFKLRQQFCEPMIRIFKEHDVRKIYLLGSGTSYHASLAIKNYFEKFLKVEAEVCIPTMFTNYVKVNNNEIYRSDQILVIGISQSGTSFSTVNAMKKAKAEGYLTVALTENLMSMICDEVDVVVPLLCGKELIPVETRGYTVTVLTGYLWSVEIAYQLACLNENEYRNLIAEIQTMLDNFEKYLAEVDDWYGKNQEELLQLKHGHIAAYGLNYCTALEGVLKCYETFRMPLSAYELEELIHGPNMAFEESTYIFIVASDEVECPRVPLFTNWFKENNVTEHVFVITGSDLPCSDKDLKFTTPMVSDLSPIVFTLAFQIMAARNCIAVGYDTSVRRANRTAFAHKY